jgi:hypothetical protein
MLMSSSAVASDPEVIFDQLTSHQWTRTTVGREFQSKITFDLKRDGSYRWHSSTDYVDRDDKGTWSFDVTGEASGVLHLSQSGDSVFRLEKDQFHASGAFGLSRGDKIAYSKDDLARKAKDLKPVKRAKEGQRLTKHAWVKTNPFDLYRLPERIEFSADQRYRATYRSKSCEHGGVWSLIKDSSDRWAIDSRADDNVCDERGGSGGLQNSYLRFEGDLVIIGDCYAPADKILDKNVFLFDYGIQTRGEFAGEFTAGKLLRIYFTHTSVDGSEYELVSFAVGMQKYKRWMKGSVADGEVQWLVEKDLEGVKVSSGKLHAHHVQFKPPAAGEAAFMIRFKYKNVWQPYDAQPTFFLTVK